VQFTLKDDVSVLTVNDASGQPRATLGVSGAGAALHLYDASGEPRAWLLVTDEGQGLELRDSTGPAVVIATADPREPPASRKSKNAAGRIHLFDHNGGVIWSAP
jgi:hypothetical protein